MNYNDNEWLRKELEKYIELNYALVKEVKHYEGLYNSLVIKYRELKTNS